MLLAEMGKCVCNYGTVVIEYAAVSGLVHTWSKHAKRRVVIKINKARKNWSGGTASVFFRGFPKVDARRQRQRLLTMKKKKTKVTKRRG